MRKFVSVILLFGILFISSGYHLFFHYLQQAIHSEVKQEIRNGISESDLSVIVISPNNKAEIKWTKKDKEFRYKGMMYDVVKIKIKNNKKYYYCLNDVKEENLIANYTKQNQKENGVLLKLRKVLNDKYFPKRFSFNIKRNRNNLPSIKYQNLYSSVFSEILSPPPKV